MGRGDLKGFLMSIDIMDIGKYCMGVLEKDVERCRELSRKFGKDINGVTYVVDMEYFALRQVLFSGVVELGIDLFRVLQDHYPEIWNSILIVNAPTYFQTVFNLFKPIFKLALLQKIHVSSKDQTGSLLLKYIDPEVLPSFLGGKRVDSSGDPMCSEFMKFGGVIPEKYYLRNRTPLLSTDPDVMDVWIPQKGFFNHPYVVREADSVITLEVRTERGSVGASMVYKEFGPRTENPDLPASDEYIDEYDEENTWRLVSPFAHLPSHLTPLKNYTYAPWPGIYVYRFENTYNWLTGRRLIYRVRVLPPGSKPV